MGSRYVKPGIPGRRVFLSEVRLDPPPRTHCRILATMMQLAHAGLAFTDRQAFMYELRKATGEPEVDPASGAVQGTTGAGMARALTAVLPWVPFDIGLGWTDTALLDGLASGDISVGVSVPVYNGLPGNLSRWSPNFDGGHQIVLLGARHIHDAPEVLWIDTMGTGSYRGEWVRWRRVRPHLSQAGGRIFTTVIERGAALSTAIVADRTYPAGSTATIAKGAPTWTLDPEALQLVAAKAIEKRTDVPVDQAYRVTNAPEGKRPRGRFLRIAFGGQVRYVRLSDATVKEATPTDPGDIEAVRAAARAEGEASGRAAAEAEFIVIAGTAYTRA